MKIKVIGDVHQKIGKYFSILKKSEGIDHTLQLGDLCVDYTAFREVKDYMLLANHAEKHRTMRGNHEYWHEILPSDLGDFGLFNNIFFVRGAFSIDRKYQMATGTFSVNEELTYKQAQECLNLYCQIKPNIIVSHDAPRLIGNLIGNPNMLRGFGFNPDTFKTLTSELLQAMIDEHPPELLVHGHFHKSHKTKIGKTTFIGLRELETYVIDQ